MRQIRKLLLVANGDTDVVHLVRHWSKIVIFKIPHLQLMRRRRVLPQIAITVKLPVAIMMYRAILTHTRSVTDRQTDGRTELPYSTRRQHAVRRAVKMCRFSCFDGRASIISSLYCES